MTVEVPVDWLGGSITIEQAEAESEWLASASGWLELKERMQPEDQVQSYCSPPETWKHLAGRAGLALVRRDTVIASILMLKN